MANKKNSVSDENKLKELTPEQEAKIPVYAKMYTDFGISTERFDYDKAVAVWKEIYKLIKKPEPLFYGPYGSPTEALRAVAYMNEVTDRLPSNTETQLFAASSKRIRYENHDFFYGNQESAWIAFYSYLQEVGGVKVDAKRWLELMRQVMPTCSWVLAFDGYVFFVDRPSILSFDSTGRRHSLTGPAIAFNSPYFEPIYAIHGVTVDKKVVEKTFTWEDIEKESNVEVRRVMIDLYGQEQYILDSGMKPVHKDDYGTLYHKEFKNDEPLMVVKVVNSTRESDGTFKDYFLRVDPKCYGGVKTGLAAVASTWRHKDGSLVFATPEEYRLSKET
jgi:hypothetical protein